MVFLFFSRLAEHLASFEAWAEEGHVASGYLVALARLKGNGCGRDEGQALLAFDALARGGDEASKAMAQQLRATVKLPQELELWATEAAQGEATAQFNLGLAYYRAGLRRR